jgi:hypothetical protein
VAADLVPAKVRITNVADNKFSVSWVTPKAASGSIEYGKVGEALAAVAHDDRDSTGTPSQYQTHHVTIDKLQPSTQYAFRILSGSAPTRFDNNGSPYSVTTGPTIAETPAARSIYGDIGSTGQPATGSIVYLTLPGSAPVSTLVTSGNNYSFTISTIRTSDLTHYIEYDPSASVASLTVENGGIETVVTVTTANAEPVPKIILGQNADYRSQLPPVAQVEPTSNPSIIPTESPSSSPSAQTPSIFNVEPLSGNSNQTSTTVVLLNPTADGETIAATKPEFRGTGPASTVVAISVHSTAAQSSNVRIAQDGTWTWTPPAALSAGQHTVTLSYLDANGAKQTLTRTFLVSPALAAEGDPAFVSTPSGTLKSPSPSPKASVKASPISSPSSSAEETDTTDMSPSPREVIPSTESGLPVTGILTPTLLTGALGFVIMVAGALMLAL